MYKLPKLFLKAAYEDCERGEENYCVIADEYFMLCAVMIKVHFCMCVYVRGSVCVCYGPTVFCVTLILVIPHPSNCSL